MAKEKRESAQKGAAGAGGRKTAGRTPSTLDRCAGQSPGRIFVVVVPAIRAMGTTAADFPVFLEVTGT